MHPVKSALAILVLALSLSACKERNPEETSTIPPADNQVLTPDAILPFTYSFQGMGKLSSYSSFFKVDDQHVHIAVKINGETLHEATLPLDRKKLESALADVSMNHLEGPFSEIDPTLTDGLVETIKCPLGERIFFRNLNNELSPPSAASLILLSNLAITWSSEMLSQIPGETIDQEIVVNVREFVKKGMSRQTLLEKFPHPNSQTDTYIKYKDWNPALVSNASRKGLFAIRIIFENDVVVSWVLSGT